MKHFSFSARAKMCAAMTIFGTLPLFTRAISIPSSSLALCRAVLAAAFVALYLRASGGKLSLAAIRAELPVLLFSGVVMGAAAWAVYGIASRVLHVAEAESRLPMLIAMCAGIAVAVVVYFVMVIVSRSITGEDVKLIPKGEKIAKLLHIK